MMENALHARDKVGVQDFVLLENYEDQDAFIENLKKRFKENLIYVSVKRSRKASRFSYDIIYFFIFLILIFLH